MLRHKERGASLVEFALVLPLIMMIVLGLVSAGVAYNLKITLTHAAREAARYAAILPT
ncbi:MAG: TadE/TadG family type IV pilus assembly protein, partial [Acidimicrobiia bacterium]|nr:TadE/TadG family type IV pilus assembly protein [Acidimicrobiia bacterium]